VDELRATSSSWEALGRTLVRRAAKVAERVAGQRIPGSSMSSLPRCKPRRRGRIEPGHCDDESTTTAQGPEVLAEKKSNARPAHRHQKLTRGTALPSSASSRRGIPYSSRVDAVAALMAGAAVSSSPREVTPLPLASSPAAGKRSVHHRYRVCHRSGRNGCSGGGTPSNMVQFTAHRTGRADTPRGRANGLINAASNWAARTPAISWPADLSRAR